MSSQSPFAPETKLSDCLKYVRSNLNKQGALKVVDWYHAKYVKPGKFAVIVHAILFVSLTSFVIRHDRIVHHKTQPYH
eukprot:gene7972-9806_t